MTPGKLAFITGPMFCGKTEELIRIATRYTIAGKCILVVKPKKDQRYGDGVICSHNYKALKAREIIKLEDVLPMINNYNMGYEGLFIDELQFIENVQIDTIRTITEAYGIDFFAAGLTLDSFRVPFPEVEKILPYSEITQLKSVCDFCGCFSAIYTYRTIEGSKEQTLVGGKETYCAICSTCLNEKESTNA